MKNLGYVDVAQVDLKLDGSIWKNDVYLCVNSRNFVDIEFHRKVNF